MEDGLAYNWHRTYDASLGRYTQSDPLGFVDGPGIYNYAGGNPLVGVDPEWLQTAPRLPLPSPIGICINILIETLKPTPVGNGGWPGGIIPTRPPQMSTPIGPLPPMMSTPTSPETPYGGQTPDDKEMRKKGPRRIDPDNGSVWEKDRSGHGGSKWKRWPNEKAHDQDRDRESVRPDGSVR